MLRDTHIKLIPAFLLHSIKGVSWQVQTYLYNIVFSTCFDLLLAVIESGLRNPGFTSQLYHSVAVCSQAILSTC